MNTILIVILLIVTLAMITLILLQKGEGGGLGMGSGPSGGKLFSVRGSSNFLTRATGVLAGLFMLLCIILAVVNGRTRITARDSVAESLAAEALTEKPLDVPSE